MTLYHETHGAGPALLMIPGFVSGSWSWFRQTEDLGRDFRLVYYDPRGIGRSREAGGAELSMKTFVDDVARVMDAAGLASAGLLGASFGGFVAQEFALRYPERVDKLILCCTSAGGPTHVGPDAEILQMFVPDPTMTVGERIRKFMRPAFSDAFNASHPEVVEDVCRMREINEVTDACYLAQIQAAFAVDTNARLGDITVETLVVTGDADRVVPHENSIRLAACIPNSRLETIDGGSHMLFIEHDGEFNRRVRDFLKG